MSVRAIVKDPIFLARRSRPATAEDAPIVRDLLDTLAAHRDGCVGMAARRRSFSTRSTIATAF